MKVHVTTAGILFLTWGVAIGGGDSDAVKKDMKLLAGEWQMQSFETNGNPLPDDQAKNIKLTIKDNHYLVDLGEQKFELTFTIDPTKKPKTIDLTMGKDKGTTRGIYEVTADTFKICRTLEAGKDRPTSFGTKEGSGTAYAVYKRKAK